ncbi:hypothetical protein [Aeromonas molluscorum]|uniref:hypothetical protein n=1 Tax=Aeromonas molluscorum TaxID=271417 RepID=UPI003F1ADF39
MCWRNLLRSPLTWLLLALAIALGGWGWSARSAAKAEGQVTTLQSDLKAADDKAKEAERREKTKDGVTINTLTGELTPRQPPPPAATPARRADHHRRHPCRHHQEAQT